MRLLILKNWNSLQCKIFKEEGICDTIEIYKMAAMISSLRELENEEEVLEKAKLIIKSYREECMVENVDFETNEEVNLEREAV